jgi:hypothetical protein
MEYEYQDPVLIESLQILRDESTFKAKVIYSLNCINNCLASSGAMLQSNIYYLST